MSPVGALLLQSFSPIVWLIGGFVEWWAIWFTLGANFTVTTVFTLTVNGATMAAAALLAGSGALGGGPDTPPAPLPAWIAAWFAILIACWTLDALLLRGLMRLRRASWSWNRYDLLLFGAANGVGLVVAAVLTWRRLTS